MKRAISTLTLLAAVALAPVAVTSLRAGGEAATEEQPAPPAHPRFDELAQKLGLNDEQKAQIKPILEKEAADLRALRDDDSLRRGQRIRKARGIMKSSTEEIRAHLTPEQQKQFDQLREERKAQMREKMKERREEKSSGAASTTGS